jgi:hypothetical protein
MKKFLSALLVVCMVLTLLPATASAAVASGTCGSNLNWTLDSAGTLTISGTGAMADYKSCGAPWYGNRSSIKSVVIGNNVTHIGDWAFGYDDGTQVYPVLYAIAGSLTIPSSVTSIGECAFEDCRFTGSLTIPASVKTIGKQAFEYCSALTSLSISYGVQSIGDLAFSECSGFTGNLTIPNSVTSIGKGAFQECSGFKGILTIPNSVTSIEGYTFFECGFTGSLTIPDSVTNISNFAYYGCSGLTSVSMPNGIATIGDYAFSRCVNLSGILNIPEAVTSIGQSAFGGCGYSKVVIPAKTNTIMREAFYECQNLREAYFKGNAPTTFNAYGDGQYEEREIYGAFDGCASDFTIYYPAGNTSWVIDSEGKWNGYKTATWTPPQEPAVTKNYTITKLNFGDIVINSSGYGVAYYQITDSNGTPVSGAQLSCTVDGNGSYLRKEVVSDGNGIIPAESPKITAETTFTVSFVPLDAGITYTGTSQSFTAKVKKLSYSQAWSGEIAAEGTASVGAAAGVSYGVGKAEANALKAEASGEAAGKLNITDSYNDGKRTLDLDYGYGLGAKIKIKSGIDTGKEKKINVSLVDGSAYAKVYGEETIGLHIEDYDQKNTDQQKAIGSYALQCGCMILPFSTFANKVMDVLKIGAANSYTGAGKISLDAGVSALNVKIGDEENFVIKGGLLGDDANCVWSFSYNDRLYDGTSVYTKSIKTDKNSGVGTNITVGSGDKVKGAKIDAKPGDYALAKSDNEISEVSATATEVGVAKEFAYKVYDGCEENIGWDTESKDTYSTVKYTGTAAQAIAANNSKLYDFSQGKFLSSGRIKDAVEALKSSGQQSSSTETEKHKKLISGDLPIGVQLGYGLEIDPSFSWETSYSFDKSDSTICGGTVYTTSKSDVSAAEVKKNTISIKEFFSEPMKIAADWLKTKLSNMYNKVKDGVKNAYANVIGTASDWYSDINTFATTSLSSDNTSYAVLSLQDAGEATTNAAIAVTIGDPYTVALYTDGTKTTQVTDDQLAENPVTLTLSYTTDMLTAAGATADMNIYIFRYDPNKNVYVRQESTQNKTAMTVTASIAEQGEYILAVDTAAPIVTNIAVSDGTSTPTLTALVSDMSGLGDFSFKVDGTELVNKSTLSNYYDEATGVFTYKFDTPLTDGTHTASFTAADSLGNAMTTAETFSFDTKGNAVAFTSVTVPATVTSADGFTATAATNDNSSVSAVTLAIKTADGTVAAYPMTLAEDGSGWSADVTGITGTGNVTAYAVASDSCGNLTTSESKTISVDVPTPDTGITMAVSSLAADSGKTTARITLHNGDLSAMSGTAMVAAYDANGRMLCVTQVGVGFTGNEDKTLSVSLNAELGKVSTVKIFMLDSASGYTPMSEYSALQAAK